MAHSLDVRVPAGTARRRGTLHRDGTQPQLAAAVPVMVVLVVTVLLGAGARAVQAQDSDAGVAGASPGPGTVVGGEIDVIQLFYADIISDVDVELTGPSGDSVVGDTVLLSEINAELRLAEPITEPGVYEVRHTIVSLDGETVEAAFEFTFVPDADPPILVFLDVEDEADGGLHWYEWLLIGAVAVVIVVLLVRLVRSVQRMRAVSRRRSES